MQSNKTWGRVNPAPSEYLIHLRRGRVIAHGHGLSIFAWPGDSWAVVPTSVQRVTFVADQVTAEKVGVEVRGTAVFRVSEPLLAFRVLDLAGPQPMQGVVEILRDMFTGAARRLVANMSVHACLTRRKEEIATELVREIRPVVSGVGRPSDSTDRGWGLVVDTIEIQDVKILSETVFQHLQAPYRAEIELAARHAGVERDQAVHLREVEASQSKLAADGELGRRRGEAEEASRLATIAREERLHLAQLEARARTAEAEHLAEEEQQRRARALRLAHLAHELETLKDSLMIQSQRAAADADAARGLREVENLVSEGRIRHDYVTQVLPELAAALASNVGSVNLTQVQGGEPIGYLGGLIAQVAALTRPPKLDDA